MSAERKIPNVTQEKLEKLVYPYLASMGVIGSMTNPGWSEAKQSTLEQATEELSKKLFRLIKRQQRITK
jgi:hypothetical protein